MDVTLSPRTLVLIDQYYELDSSKSLVISVRAHNAADQKEIIDWLNIEKRHTDLDEKIKRKIEFVLASLHASLLHDLLTSMSHGAPSTEAQPVSRWAKLKFFLLAAAGTLFAVCEGFDSITTMLGIFSLPAFATLLAGLVFSVFSVMVFYGFNLVQISKNLGVTLTDTPKLLDVYHTELQEIKALRMKISKMKHTQLSSNELQALNDQVVMLGNRVTALSNSSKQFDLALNSKKMKAAKAAFVGLAGILFFGGGFFAGQSVAVFLLGMVVAGAGATFWPVTLFSIVVGLAAFSLYWYVERIGLEQLISGWFGLDEEKIQALCANEHVKEELDELDGLHAQLSGVKTLKAHKPHSMASHDDSATVPVSSSHLFVRLESGEQASRALRAGLPIFSQKAREVPSSTPNMLRRGSF